MREPNDELSFNEISIARIGIYIYTGFIEEDIDQPNSSHSYTQARSNEMNSSTPDEKRFKVIINTKWGKLSAPLALNESMANILDVRPLHACGPLKSRLHNSISTE